MNYQNIEIDGIDFNDAPDFVDAFISYAEHEDGQFVYERVLDKIY